MRSLLAVGLLASVLQADPITLLFDVEGTPLIRSYTEAGMTITNAREHFCNEQELIDEPWARSPVCHINIGSHGVLVSNYGANASKLKFSMEGQTFNLISVIVDFTFAGGMFTLPGDILPPQGNIHVGPVFDGTSWSGSHWIETPFTHNFTDPAWHGITEFYLEAHGYIHISGLTFEPVGSVPEPSTHVLFSLAGMFMIGVASILRKKVTK